MRQSFSQTFLHSNHGITISNGEKKDGSRIQFIAADVDRMKVAGQMEFDTIDAIAMTKKELDGRVPLIGFAGAPWTIFSYMIEGSASKTFSKAKKFLYTEPELAHKVFFRNNRSTINYLKGQIGFRCGLGSDF